MCNVLEGWYYTDMYRIIIQGCSDRMYLRCLRRRSYQMDIINDYWKYIVKGKARPLQAWTGPEGSRRMRLPDFKTVGT